MRKNKIWHFLFGGPTTGWTPVRMRPWPVLWLTGSLLLVLLATEFSIGLLAFLFENLFDILDYLMALVDLVDYQVAKLLSTVFGMERESAEMWSQWGTLPVKIVLAWYLGKRALRGAKRLSIKALAHIKRSWFSLYWPYRWTILAGLAVSAWWL